MCILKKVLLIIIIGGLLMIKASQLPKPYEINNFLGINPNSSLDIQKGEAVDIENFRIKNDFNIVRREGQKEFNLSCSNIAVANGATSSGNITVVINGNNIVVAVLNADTKAQVATKIYTAINASNLYISTNLVTENVLVNRKGVDLSILDVTFSTAQGVDIDIYNIDKFYVANKCQYAKLGADTKEYLYAYGFHHIIGGFSAGKYLEFLVKIDVDTNNAIAVMECFVISLKTTPIDNNLIFVSNKYLYFFYFATGNSYLSKCDGETITLVTPTVPLIYSGVAPLLTDKDSKVLQLRNILTKSKKISYTADGTATYWMEEILDSITSITVNGVEETYHTPNLYAGNTVFTVGHIPTTGATVIIEFVATQASTPELIYNCTSSMFYGGKNDIDLFVWGNPDHLNTVYHCHDGDVTYFADTGFRTFGDSTITDIVTQNTTQVIFSDTKIFNANISITTAGVVSYPYDTISYQKGHNKNYPNVNVQVINNNPVFIGADKTISQLSVANTRDERVISYLSKFDISSFLKSTSIITRDIMSTFDYEEKKEYWIFFKETIDSVDEYKALIYNYYNNTWYKFGGLRACFTPILINDKLYCFGTETSEPVFSYFDTSLVSDFYLDTVSSVVVEFENPIDAYYEFPYLALSRQFQKKTISKIGIGIQPNTEYDSSLTVEFGSNAKTTMNDTTFFLEKGHQPQLLKKNISLRDIQHLKLKLISDSIYNKAEIINVWLYVQYNGLF